LGDPVLGALGARRPVFHWHAYRYDLPAGAVHLASTATCQQRHADAVFNSFLDLIGRPERRRALPSRGMPAWVD
jgi:GMP synthase-like glutamine amidotransferase